MAFSLSQRASIARIDSTFQHQIIGALVKHAKWTLRTEDRPEEEVALAKQIIANPDAFSWRFGVAILTEPAFDALDTLDDLDDEEAQDTVAELFPLFAGV